MRALILINRPRGLIRVKATPEKRAKISAKEASLAARDECWRALPLFETMRPETFRRMMAGARRQSFSADALLLREGEPARIVYVLLDGQVEFSAAWRERETVLAIATPSATFMLAAAALEAPALMSARTLETSDLLMLEAEAVRQAMADDVAFAASVARDLADAYRLMVTALKQQKLRSSVERLAHYLMTLPENQSIRANSVVLRHEKRVLASLLGMTPENLSRAFASLRPYGVIVQGAAVTLTDPQALMALADPHSPMRVPAGS